MSVILSATSALSRATGLSPRITVLAGGVSSEREVSLGSGAAAAQALARLWPTRLIDVTAPDLPLGLDPDRDVVFSTLHGTFGEDGGMQALLDAACIVYAGCGTASSALTMDKAATKRAAAQVGVNVAADLTFSAATRPEVGEVIAALGERVVFKPNDQGSSVGLALPEGREEIGSALAVISAGNWIAEPRLVGRELSVGVLGGKAMGVVEIRPRSGVYDFASKYTKGATEYLAPAPLEAEVAMAVQRAAESAFAACGCRDYARVDFILISENEFYLLEINTLPGMKETSLLPMSARCAGLDFTALVRELVVPAVNRLQAARFLANK
ncbi:D-alanine--D-alanine ligase [Verrucomicrobia bacterium IMCC26134]|nr:D-alanine--D-alanine ligase [Verrucomicrobia bacterium IMCC26134]